MIRVAGLCRRYGSVTALDSVDFSVPRGAVVGFLGPNGAGKTTTMKILVGALAPSAGRAWIAGHPVDDPRVDTRRRLGYLPETAPVPGELTVRDTLRFVARVRRIPRGHRRAAVERVIERCGLGPVARRPVGQLSKGYRQRVGLAQAIVHAPDLLILDEPTSGLDPNQRVEIRALIRDLGAERTVLFSSHVLAEVQAVATRVLILDEGRVVADATPEQLLAGEGLRLRVHGAAPAEVADRLRAVPGAGAVRVVGEAVWVDAADDRAPALARAVVDAGWDLVELSPQRADLEAVFRRLTARTP